jgi:DNA-binding response OmpR family regulator
MLENRINADELGQSGHNIDRTSASYCPCCGSRAIEKLRIIDYVCGACGVQFHIVSDAPILSAGALEIDRATCKVRMRGQEVPATAIEFRLLDFLMSHRGVIYDRYSLVSAVWGHNHNIEDHNVDVRILRLRRKIEPEPSKPLFILTHRGFGYSFNDRIG